MTYKYGINSVVKTSIAETPVSTETCVVYIGCANASTEHVGDAVRCTSYNDYLRQYHNNTEPSTLSTLDESAKVAFDYVGIDHAYFVNVLSSTSSEEDDIHIVSSIDNALAQVIMNSSERPNVICISRAVKYADGLEAIASKLASVCNGGIVGKYSSIAVIGVEQASNQLSSGKPDASKINKPSSDGHIISCWGDVEVGASKLPLEAVVSAMYAKQDGLNAGNIPYRSIGNISIPFAQGLSCNQTSISVTETDVEDVVKKGIITIINIGNSQWRTWGDHTSAFSDGGAFDELYRFDSNVRIMVHIYNRFIDKWRTSIDNPMTLKLRNDVINEEQNYLNYLLSIGALIGDPKCEFKKEDNSVDNVGQGHFYFTDTYTTCIPAKYLQMNLVWSSEGLSAYTD